MCLLPVPVFEQECLFWLSHVCPNSVHLMSHDGVMTCGFFFTHSLIKMNSTPGIKPKEFHPPLPGSDDKI